ncbi:MAG: 16S rRNA (cytidine(1402)-2'-O)-methyltransferase [Rhodanobacteraceae bacterium]
MPAEPGKGTLWVVATPIGNLDDISVRALKVLRDVAVIAAEDTRHSRVLLQHHGIDTPTLTLHDHNERAALDSVLERLAAGDDVALVSDAGTPLISDPGFRLVRAAREQDLPIAAVPGACAAVAALSVAGLPTDRFVFEGFLPSKQTARRARLEALADESRTLVLYESSHRIAATLADLVAVFGGERAAVLARELTKLHETVLSLPLAQLAERVVADRNQQRGEIVLLVAGSEVDDNRQLAEGRRVLGILQPHLPPARAAKLAAAISGAPRKVLYGSEDR